jgi:hypothetical protein
MENNYLERLDRHGRKTKLALLASFKKLAINKPYFPITIKDIVGEANVSRSVFYEHFCDKDDLLFVSMDEAISVLTQNATGSGSVDNSVTLLSHLKRKDSLGSLLLSLPLQKKFIHKLALRIAETLEHKKLILTKEIPLDAISIQLASTQMFPLIAWIQGGVTGSTEQIASLLVQSNFV